MSLSILLLFFQTLVHVSSEDQMDLRLVNALFVQYSQLEALSCDQDTLNDDVEFRFWADSEYNSESFCLILRRQKSQWSTVFHKWSNECNNRDGCPTKVDKDSTETMKFWTKLEPSLMALVQSENDNFQVKYVRREGDETVVTLNETCTIFLFEVCYNRKLYRNLMFEPINTGLPDDIRFQGLLEMIIFYYPPIGQLNNGHLRSKTSKLEWGGNN